MNEIENRELKYLFKLKQTPRVKRAIISMMQKKNWLKSSHGFECIESELMLSGWSKSRRIVLVRKKGKESKKIF